MAISLQKGQKISLSKEGVGLKQVVVGLGWDEVEQKRGLFSFKPAAIDCDASVLLLKEGKLRGKKDVVYFGQLRHDSDAVRHMGDNLTGEGDGDDEQIFIDLEKVPAEYDRIVIIVNIYDPINRRQHFGLIRNAFCRVVDAKTNKELCIYNLAEQYDNMTSLIFGEIYRHNGEWKFNAMGQATKDISISEICKRYN